MYNNVYCNYIDFACDIVSNAYASCTFCEMALRATIDKNNLIRLVLSGLECYTGTQMTTNTTKTSNIGLSLQCGIVTTALSCAIFELFDVE